jgi:hypothetical protein
MEVENIYRADLLTFYIRTCLLSTAGVGTIMIRCLRLNNVDQVPSTKHRRSLLEQLDIAGKYHSRKIAVV